MTVLDYLMDSANNYPNKTAFSDSEKSITFAQLRAAAQSVATQLIHTLNIKNQPIAVLIGRNTESICAFTGVAMSRNFYVPIDDSQPILRIKTILEQMQPAAIISIGSDTQQISGISSLPILDYYDLINKEPDYTALAEIEQSRLDTDPLYAICTSGSTGVPKGVLISHRSVIDFIPVFCDTFAFTDNEIFGNQAPFDFDVSVKDIYSTLYLGATMHIIPKVCFSMPKKLMDVLESEGVTTIIWAVSALCIAAGVNVFKYKIPQRLNKILFSGEVMPVKMLNKWRTAYPNAMFVNLYGPTEITCNCMYYIIDREFALTEKLPLGKAFKNENVFVLNEENKPVTVGETGEICVCGTCLALGYYRNPEKTAQVFVQNPLNNNYPELIYRTGDMAQLAQDNEYYFAARKDFQIKHMGHRIELEEIEIHINAIDGITRACCLFDTEHNKTVACYAGTIEKEDIVNALKDCLPKYMIPNIIIKFDSLPINKNGKIDRQSLRQIYFDGISKND